MKLQAAPIDGWKAKIDENLLRKVCQGHSKEVNNQTIWWVSWYHKRLHKKKVSQTWFLTKFWI